MDDNIWEYLGYLRALRKSLILVNFRKWPVLPLPNSWLFFGINPKGAKYKLESKDKYAAEVWPISYRKGRKVCFLFSLIRGKIQKFYTFPTDKGIDSFDSYSKAQIALRRKILLRGRSCFSADKFFCRTGLKVHPRVSNTAFGIQFQLSDVLKWKT